MGRGLGLRWPTAREWLLVAVIVAVFVADVVQTSVILVPFFFVPLVAAAAVEGPRVTAALSVLAMTLVLVSGVDNGYVTGVDFWVRLTAMTMFAVLAVVLAAIIERRQRLLESTAEEEHRDRLRLAAVFSLSPTPAAQVLVGARGVTRVLVVNSALTRMLGIQSTDPDAAALRDLVELEDREIVRSVLAAAIDAVPETQVADEVAVAAQREIRIRTSAGELRWVLMSASAVGPPGPGGEREVVLQLEDITSRRQAEEALTVQALTDSVTGLPNRHALTFALATALERLTRHPGLVCVLFCDLDQFKHVNDHYGHQHGDQLLREVADRLRAGVRPDDTVARLGGDEFVIVYEGLREATDAVLMAMRLQDRIRTPWLHDGLDYVPTMSVGVVATDDPRAPIEDLLRRADVAMYRAKDSGRDRVELYDRSLDAELAHAVTMQRQLRAALQDDGLVLHYQPIVTLDTGVVTGAEALLRLRGPDNELVPPSAFLPHAEASGLIAPVGAWVINRALADLSRWRDLGLPYQVAVNISPTQLRRDGFPGYLLEQLALNEIDPSWLCLEITETVLVQDSDKVTAVLRRLHDRGVRIALDDFGTGYSSLSWLNVFPVDTIKIDISFVRNLGTDPGRTAIVAALLHVAGQLRLNVVAEGIETPRQRELLIDMGCPQGQGFLLGRPASVDDPCWTRLTTAPETAPTGSARWR